MLAGGITSPESRFRRGAGVPYHLMFRSPVSGEELSNSKCAGAWHRDNGKPDKCLRKRSAFMVRILLGWLCMLQNKDDSLTGYQIPEAAQFCKHPNVLQVVLIKDCQGEDHEGMGVTNAHAIVHRTPIMPGSGGTCGREYVQEVSLARALLPPFFTVCLCGFDDFSVIRLRRKQPVPYLSLQGDANVSHP